VTAGRLRGIVERVKTGTKEPFARAEDLGKLIERMLRVMSVRERGT